MFEHDAAADPAGFLAAVTEAGQAPVRAGGPPSGARGRAYRQRRLCRHRRGDERIGRPGRLRPVEHDLAPGTREEALASLTQMARPAPLNGPTPTTSNTGPAGGPTALTNLALLCAHDHTFVHQHDLTATVPAFDVTWQT